MGPCTAALVPSRILMMNHETKSRETRYRFYSSVTRIQIAKITMPRRAAPLSGVQALLDNFEAFHHSALLLHAWKWRDPDIPQLSRQARSKHRSPVKMQDVKYSAPKPIA